MTKPTPRPDKSLQFAEWYVDHIKTGSKTATVRYNDEKDVSEGDLLKAKVDETPFATLRVTSVEIAEVRKVPELIRRMDERHGADDWKELREKLNHFYSDEIYATTDVKVIVFEVEHD
jgi:hypothetical protein